MDPMAKSYRLQELFFVETDLSQLRAKDTFWMQEFNSDTYSWNSENVALPANPKNIEAASKWVEQLSSGGGTNLYQAIENSVTKKLDTTRANIAFIITDGEPTSGISSWELIQKYTKEKNSMKAYGQKDRQKWALFNFAIGSNAPMTELNKLSILNMGQELFKIFTHHFRSTSGSLPVCAERVN